jgi:glyoxylase-like metal-dependent hydrolase (beta-lactamase superfamily II)
MHDCVVIDAGPALDSHHAALAKALWGRNVVGIIATHCHNDHSPASHYVKELTGAPLIAVGPHPVVNENPDDDPEEEDDPDDESEEIRKELLRAVGKEDGEEREIADLKFVPDITPADGEVFITTSEFTLTAVHTPGHTSNHLAIYMDTEKALFTGDHLMGWSSTSIVPPDGNMRTYMESLRKIRDGEKYKSFWPTHGGPIIGNTAEFVDAYLEHRIQRQQQVLEQLAKGPHTMKELVKAIYTDVPTVLHKPARTSVRATILGLWEEGRVKPLEGDRPLKRSKYVLA